jgi:hypothetical protein
MFNFKKLFSINLKKASKLATSASNMFAKAHAQLDKANTILASDREQAISHLEELQKQVREAELTLEANKKVQEKLQEFIV